MVAHYVVWMAGHTAYTASRLIQQCPIASGAYLQHVGYMVCASNSALGIVC